MSQGPSHTDPSLPPISSPAEPEAEREPAETLDDDVDDSFDEFEAYAKLAAGARIKGVAKAPDAMKMRGNRDAGAGRKFNKPAHKDKRGP